MTAWISLDVAALAYGVTRRTIERWITAGAPCLRRAGRTLVRLADLDKWRGA